MPTKNMPRLTQSLAACGVHVPVSAGSSGPAMSTAALAVTVAPRRPNRSPAHMIGR